MSYQFLKFDKEDQIGIVTLNRPDKLNALRPQMQEELGDAFELLDRDDETREVVLTGVGRGFCAGADIQRGFQVSIDRKKEDVVEDYTRRPSATFFSAITRVKRAAKEILIDIMYTWLFTCISFPYSLAWLHPRRLLPCPILCRTKHPGSLRL